MTHQFPRHWRWGYKANFPKASNSPWPSGSEAHLLVLLEAPDLTCCRKWALPWGKQQEQSSPWLGFITLPSSPIGSCACGISSQGPVTCGYSSWAMNDLNTTCPHIWSQETVPGRRDMSGKWLKASPLKVWSSDHQPEHHPGACWKYRTSGHRELLLHFLKVLWWFGCMFYSWSSGLKEPKRSCPQVWVQEEMTISLHMSPHTQMPVFLGTSWWLGAHTLDPDSMMLGSTWHSGWPQANGSTFLSLSFFFWVVK